MDTTLIIETLAASPLWLRSGFADLSDEDAWRAPAPGEWCAAELLAHLRASDAVLAPRIFQLLIRPDAPLTGFDERAWAEVASRAQLPIAQQLAAFEAQRAELVGVLRTLAIEEWDRRGQHETRGRLTLREIATELADHEREHRHQFEAVIAALRSLTRDEMQRSIEGASTSKADQKAGTAVAEPNEQQPDGSQLAGV
jgi:hypothetical protein